MARTDDRACSFKMFFLSQFHMYIGSFYGNFYFWWTKDYLFVDIDLPTVGSFYFRPADFYIYFFFLFNICCHSVTKLVQSVLRSLLLLEPVGYSCQCGCNSCAGLRHNALFIAESLLLNDYCRNIYHNKQLNA